MARMGRLKAGNMRAEFRLFKPIRHRATQAAHAFRRMPSILAVQRVAGKGRFTLAGDDKHGAQAFATRFHEETAQFNPC